MPIWKCASGGYHSGKDCFEEFGKFMKHTEAKHDVQMVRLVDRHTLAAHLSEIGHSVDADTIDAVLRGLVELTPEGTNKKSWDKIHGRK